MNSFRVHWKMDKWTKGREPLEFQLGKRKVIKGNLFQDLFDYFAILSG